MYMDKKGLTEIYLGMQGLTEGDAGQCSIVKCASITPGMLTQLGYSGSYTSHQMSPGCTQHYTLHCALYTVRYIHLV